MLVTISKYPKGANLDASAYLNESISKIWPKQAKIPIIASHNHCTFVRLKSDLISGAKAIRRFLSIKLNIFSNKKKAK